MATSSPVSIGFLLHDVARNMRHIFDGRARVLGVTRSQWRALIYLSRVDGLTQTELADSLDVERISAGRMVDRLVESGLVERRADPSDRRVWRLHLLPAAHGIVSELTSIGEQVEAETLSVLTTDQQVLFLNLLEALNAGLKRPKFCTDYKKEVE